MPYTEEERKQRHKEATKRWREKNREKNKEKQKEYRQENKEKLKEKKKEYDKQYREDNKEKIKQYIKEYRQTPEGKKKHTITKWVSTGLKESKEDLDRIYHLRETQVLCNACDCILTRDGDSSSTQAHMDHDHETGRFRHIICHNCNTNDNWKKYFC